MLNKRWKIGDKPPVEDIENLKRAINASDPLAIILLQRGIRDFDAARYFFNPALTQLHDPFAMKDMDKAVDRITLAINEGENILIYGDYDVDGTTAVSLLYHFLSHQYEHVSYYIPDRYTEGYGVSFQGIDYASDNGVSLIIALDCGVKAIEEINYAAERGIDFIVCDHHLPGSTLPAAAALLNPLQDGCTYPFKSLCGCGIGFKLVQALVSAWRLDRNEPFQYLDLAAIATASDIVPMVGENRVLTYWGLRLMEQKLRPGLAQMLEEAGLATDGKLNKKELTVSDLVFKIGPRINAAGRMKHGSLAVELMIASTQLQAEVPASSVNDKNRERQEVDKQIKEEAREMILADVSLTDAKSTVLFAPHWHKGVVGIVASRVQEFFYRPTIILTESNGKATGSARSVQGFDVHAAIERCADLLENFGGHPAAAGMTLALENLDAFRARFEEAVSQSILPEQLIPTIDVDVELDFSQITPKFFNQINRMGPFGPQNMRPTFVTHGVIDTGRSKRVGDGTHLKLEVYQEGMKQNPKSGIAFGLGDMITRVESREAFSMVYTLEENIYKNHSSIQLLVKDIKFID